MSSELAIGARGLTKSYLRYANPQDRLKQAVYPRMQRALRPLAGLLGTAATTERVYFTRFWALKGIDFEVARGETVGIIGKNGSGKSTLLKLVCGTLAPTEGEIKVNGRIAALLELGSGFNPEFTGRENIYLNASVLGLTRVETDARIGDIIGFADIGDFVDQPVKSYSSGMAMRLAFAVIAHVDADVLVIDEALAVGDAYFQQKCLRWLRQFREKGTVLFCGHDTGAILSFCHHAIWLDKGAVRMKGSAKEVCEAYNAFIQVATMGLPEHVVKLAKPRPSLVADAGKPDAVAEGAAGAGGQTTAVVIPPPPEDRRPVIFDNLEGSSSFGSGLARIASVTMTSTDGADLTWIVGGEEVVITARIEIDGEIDRPIVGFHVKDRLGQPIFGDNTYQTYLSSPLTLNPTEMLTANFRFRLPYLQSGRYAVTVAIASGTLETHIQHHWLHDAYFFDVHSPFKNGVMIAITIAEMSLAQSREVVIGE